jgi:hypothetical protein
MELGALAGAMRRAVADEEPGAAVAGSLPLPRLLAAPLARPRFQSALITSFALLGLVLSAISTYGVLVFFVRLRTREIGIRMALGADPPTVRRFVLRQGLTIGVLGVFTGLAAASRRRPRRRSAAVRYRRDRSTRADHHGGPAAARQHRGGGTADAAGHAHESTARDAQRPVRARTAGHRAGGPTDPPATVLAPGRRYARVQTTPARDDDTTTSRVPGTTTCSALTVIEWRSVVCSLITT